MSEKIFIDARGEKYEHNGEEVKVRIGCYGIIKNDKGETLIIKTNKGDFYEFPGGGCDTFENFTECVIREVKEETGYDVEVLDEHPFKILHNYSYFQGKKLFIKKVDFYFKCRLVSEVRDEFNTDFGEEILDLKWVDKSEIENIGFLWFLEKDNVKIDLVE